MVMAEGYGAQEGVRCIQTQRWSPGAPAVLVCCVVSPSSCSSSCSDLVLPTFGAVGLDLPGHQQVRDRDEEVDRFTTLTDDKEYDTLNG